MAFVLVSVSLHASRHVALSALCSRLESETQVGRAALTINHLTLASEKRPGSDGRRPGGRLHFLLFG
jgi:hypothetical protein